MKKAFIILFLFICVRAYSGTIWRMNNQTNLDIIISCESSPIDGLNNMRIKKDFLLSYHEQLDHDWGFDWDNDGMGLNPSNWICKVYDFDHGSLMSSTTFDTTWGGWGIDLELIFKAEGNHYAIRKLDH